MKRALLIATATLATLAGAPTATVARSDQGAHLTMTEARTGTRHMAQVFAERMTPPGVNGRTAVGKCRRKTVSLVACRFAAYGTEDVCRGWSYVLDQGNDGEGVGWTTRLRCNAATT